MADTYTTHLNLIEQDPNTRPDIEKENTNLETLDSEVWARGKTFNGQAVGADGGFHVNSIPEAENLKTSASQASAETYIVRTTGGEASIPQEGDAWLMILKGARTHTGYTAQSINMTVTPMTRTAPAAITATINEATFEAYVGTAGTYTIYYDGSAWSTSPALYGLTVANTPIEGDSIVMEWDGNNGAEVSVNAVERQAPPDITATIDEDTFVSYVATSGTTTLTYSTTWSADPANYGITVQNTPIAGDVITVVYVKEVRGTITQSNPATFVSCGWNLYNHTEGYARVIKYSTQYNFKIAGTYTGLEFSTTPTGSRTTITPISGGFSIPSDGYIHVTGGNATDTVIWMTWSDWGSGYNWTGSEQGDFEAYEEFEIDFSSFMAQRFPYGLMQVGNVHDEINLNVGVATSRVERLAYNSTNLATAKASGRAFEYDENYIYLEKATADTYDFEVDGDYTAFDHGMEWFTGTDQAVYAETIYGANLKNKLERDVLTISQQTLTASEKSQVRSNIGAIDGSNVVTLSGDDTMTGRKDFTAMVYIKNHKNPYIYFTGLHLTEGYSGYFANVYAETDDQKYGQSTFRFLMYSPTATGGRSSYYEYYDLPQVDVGRTANASYKVCTTKETGIVKTGTNATSLTVAANTWTYICTLTLSPGKWIIIGGFQFSTDFSQPSAGCIVQGSNNSTMIGTLTRGTGTNGGGFNISCFAQPSSETVYKLGAWQGSSASKTASSIGFKAMRIA